MTTRLPQHSGLRAPAVVVGLAIHGLAIARSLARRGIEVHCLAEASAPRAPTEYTRYAKVHRRSGLNTPDLVAVLAELAEARGSDQPMVLFPTSDRMAKHIALGWPDLERHYALSWAPCRDLVLQLQRKDELAAHCERHGLRHPRSVTLQQPEDADSVAGEIRYPAVVKPVHPLSRFKALRVESFAELRGCVEKYGSEAPFVIQEWIDGDEPSLYSCTAYVDRGRVLGRFTSRKLDAAPRGLGQGTVFEPIESEEILALGNRFLETLKLSGPVAIEFKRDRAGEFWIIEANVGRTEYIKSSERRACSPRTEAAPRRSAPSSCGLRPADRAAAVPARPILSVAR